MLESGSERILILVPHADDEVLGCGGLIEKAVRFGNSVKVVVAAIGDTIFYHKQQLITAKVRKLEFKKAMEFLGCKNWEFLFEDKEALLDTVPQKELISKIDYILLTFKPSMVFIPYPSFHQDHQCLFQACMAALRPTPNNHFGLIAMYEYPFITWQYPPIGDTGHLYLDISMTIDKKIEALKQHKSQIRPSDHLISPESIRKWAEKRGMEIGVAYAEKYYLLRGRIL